MAEAWRRRDPTHLAVLPGRAQPRQELLERGRRRRFRSIRDGLVGQGDKLGLQRTYVAQKRYGVEPGMHGFGLPTRIIGGARVGEA